MQNEHDDDMIPSVAERNEVETEDFAQTNEEVEQNPADEEPDDADVVGK